MYAAGRIISEYYREPENELWLDFTRGQYLSFGVIAMGFGFLLASLKQRGKNNE